MFRSLIFFIAATLVHAEIYTFTLKQAVDRSLRQNPDIALARLDEQKALDGIRVARDPFSPKVGIGSGLAYSSGFPLSIEGAAPSVVRAQASQYLFNRQQTFAVAQARETARGAGFLSASKRDEVAYRTSSLYLDGDRAARLQGLAAKQVESLRKVVLTVQGRVQEGRELPLETKRATLELQKARQRQEAFAGDQDFAERSLAIVLGFTALDRARATADERSAPEVPSTEEAAVDQALLTNKDIKRLHSAMLAKGLEIKGAQAARLPRVDLVAQYALLARFNNYDKFFNAFQRHNTQLGVSFQVPLLTGPGVAAAVAQAQGDSSHLRIEMDAARNRIMLDVHQSFAEIKRAEMSVTVSRADLDFTRESLSVLLAQLGEGRASLRQVEEARYQEDEKWIAFYDAQFASERARLNLLRQTGELAASLK
jgi:outer membrane protein